MVAGPKHLLSSLSCCLLWALYRVTSRLPVLCGAFRLHAAPAIARGCTRISSISIKSILDLYFKNQVLLFPPRRAGNFKRDH